MITSLACICGGVGEALVIGGLISCVAWIFRKLCKRKHKHSDSCKH